jgi:DNA repair protein RecO (recombination protein O)
LIDKELGYILHQKPFSETSVLVDVFTQTFGRMSLLAKGAKRLKSPFKAYLFPFRLLAFSFVGKNELKTLTHLEAKENINFSDNNANQLILGLYLNELILRFLKKEDPHPELFSTFHCAMGYLFNLDGLCAQHEILPNQGRQLILRAIEIKLLTSVGYGINFEKIADTHDAIIKTEFYDYYPMMGFKKSITQHAQSYAQNHAISGAILLLMNSLELESLSEFLTELTQSEVEMIVFLRESKKILRQSLDHHLGEKKIYTRELARIGD